MKFQEKTYAFIGASKMGSAIAHCLNNKVMQRGQGKIILTNRNKSINIKHRKEYPDFEVTDDNAKAISKADIIFICVPSVKEKYAPVLEQIKNNAKKGTIVISIMAGATATSIEKTLCPKSETEVSIVNFPVVWLMPNMGAIVGDMAGGYCFAPNFPVDKKQTVKDLFIAMQLNVEQVDEKNINTVIGICGSGLALGLKTLEEIAQAAVIQGLNVHKARNLAAKVMEETSRLIREQKCHPNEFIDMIVRPGDMTTHALHQLKSDGFDEAILIAVDSAIRKARDMQEDEP